MMMLQRKRMKQKALLGVRIEAFPHQLLDQQETKQEEHSENNVNRGKFRNVIWSYGKRTIPKAKRFLKQNKPSTTKQQGRTIVP
jgi:hypothetical protein